MRAALLPTLLLLLLGAASAAAQADLVLLPHVLQAARRPAVADGLLLVYNPAAGTTARLTRVEARVEGPGTAPQVVYEQALDAPLPGDPEYGAVNALIERLPVEVTELHRPERAFAPADAPVLEGQAMLDAWEAITGRVAALRDAYAAGAPRPFVELDAPVPFGLVFPPGTAAGATRRLRLAVEWTDAAGAARSTSATRTLTWLGPAPGLPSALLAAFPGATVHAGDLHVHSCHGEAVGACAPSTDCAAESLQTSGSFSYAQLKSQYQALGLDWFTATDHSYCINSEGEYQQIVGECAALSDGAFLCLPDTELSSDEVGPQIGSDLGDTLCLGGTSANHMGAHGITSRKPGGGDGLLGFCNGLFSDALQPFDANAAAIRAEGGIPIANHPTDSSFGWNSFAATAGLEANQMQGVEIWNGAFASGQGGHVGQWIDWLLGGRVLYAYSGSDTHDEAFAFGADQVLLLPGDSFDTPTVRAAVRRGRLFVSNGPSLVLEVEQDGLSLMMGTLQSLAPDQPPTTVAVKAHYDFGAATGTVTLFRGRVGDASETVLAQSGPLTGEGVFSAPDGLELGTRSWYRAYAEAPGVTRIAYTNPVFFLPGGCPAVAYGTGLGGANTASLTSPSSPALGSVDLLRLSGFSGSSVAYLILSLGPVPGGLPFKGGSLLVSVPFVAAVPLPLTGGAIDLPLAIPDDPGLAGAHLYWQAVAPDPGAPFGFTLSNGLDLGLCAPFG